MTPKWVVRGINSATRGGTRMALTMERHGTEMRTLCTMAGVPDSLVDAFLVPDVRIVRRDTGIHRLAFFLRRGADRLRLSADRTTGEVTFAALRQGTLFGQKPPGENSRREALALADPWRGADGADLPVVHVFAIDRIWDAYLQAVRTGIGEEDRGKAILAHRVAGKAVVDPTTVLPPRIAVTLVDEGALAGAHHISALAELESDSQLREYGSALMPPRHADADALFISFELEKHQWLEQTQALATFLNRTHRQGIGFARLLVNGMTSPWDGRPADFFETIEEVERGMIARLTKRLEFPLEVVWMFGWTFAQKLEAARGARFAIAPIGSASLIPNALGVAGVSYSNKDRIRWIKWLDNPDMCRIPPEILADRDDILGYGRLRADRPVPRVSYSMHVGEFLRFANRHYRATSAPKPPGTPTVH